MFEAQKYLRLSTNPKTNHSNSSQKSISSITLNGCNTYTPTIDETTTPINFDNINHLSLSSLPSIATLTQPHSNQSNQSNQSNGHSSYHSNMSSSHTIQLNLSETTLTPNIAAIATNINNNSNTQLHMSPNSFIINDDNFSLDTINTNISKQSHSKSKSKSKSKSDPEELKIIMESVESKNDSKNDIDETKQDENDLNFLQSHGYIRGKKIATTLQGFIYEIISSKTGIKYVVKQTNKQLHKSGITIQNGKKYAVKEDILNEKSILEIISKQNNTPQFMVKFIEFFESEKYYYLVMEHGGQDLFQFIMEAHKYIQNKKLSIKEWRKFIKYIFWQMSVLLLWLHNTCNATHLDVSLENILVKNAKFIKQSNGQYSISTNIQIKFCDFGLAEFYCIDHENIDYINKYGFKSTKYCGKTNYKSPQVYSKQGEFDARKADVWSLGVVLFCMAIGAPPYKRPNTTDECFNKYIKKGHIAQLLYQWKRHSYVTERMLSLLKSMLKYDKNNRFSMDDVIQHPWLRTYYSKYYQLIKNDLLAIKYADINL